METPDSASIRALFVPMLPILAAILLFPGLMGFRLPAGALRAPRDPGRLARFGPGIQGFRPLAQLPQAGQLVLVLAAILLAGHHDPARQMPEAHRAFGLINVLASGAARTKDIDPALAQQVLVRIR